MANFYTESHCKVKTGEIPLKFSYRGHFYKSKVRYRLVNDQLSFIFRNEMTNNVVTIYRFNDGFRIVYTDYNDKMLEGFLIDLVKDINIENCNSPNVDECIDK